jgi:arsenite methyltransferase
MQKEIIKKEIKKNYSKIALEESNPNSCCMPHEFNFDSNTILNPKEALSNAIGYRDQDLQSIPKESNLGLGCGAPLLI